MYNVQHVLFSLVGFKHTKVRVLNRGIVQDIVSSISGSIEVLHSFAEAEHKLRRDAAELSLKSQSQPIPDKPLWVTASAAPEVWTRPYPPPLRITFIIKYHFIGIAITISFAVSGIAVTILFDIVVIDFTNAIVITHTSSF